MQFVGRVFSTVSEFYKDLNPATLSGAIDILVVERPDGQLHCSPFHVRFGKLSLLRPQEKVVEVRVNGKLMENFCMKVGEAGEAFFVMESQAPVPMELQTSPLQPPTHPTPEMAAMEPLDLSSSSPPALTSSLLTKQEQQEPRRATISNPLSTSMGSSILKEEGFASPGLADESDFDGELLGYTHRLGELSGDGSHVVTLRPLTMPPNMLSEQKHMNQANLATSMALSLSTTTTSAEKPWDALRKSMSSSDDLRSAQPYKTPTQYFTTNPFPGHPLSDSEADHQHHQENRKNSAQNGGSVGGLSKPAGTPLSDSEMDYSYPALENRKEGRFQEEWNWTWGDFPKEKEAVEKVDVRSESVTVNDILKVLKPETHEDLPVSNPHVTPSSAPASIQIPEAIAAPPISSAQSSPSKPPVDPVAPVTERASSLVRRSSKSSPSTVISPGVVTSTNASPSKIVTDRNASQNSTATANQKSTSQNQATGTTGDATQPEPPLPTPKLTEDTKMAISLEPAGEKPSVASESKWSPTETNKSSALSTTSEPAPSLVSKLTADTASTGLKVPSTASSLGRALSPEPLVKVTDNIVRSLNLLPIFLTRDDLKLVEMASSSMLQSAKDDNIDKLFNDAKISWDQAKERPQILTDPQTVFRIQNKYYTSNVIVPVILSLLAFNQVLPDESLNSLFPKSSAQASTSTATPLSSSTAVSGWRQWWSRGTSTTRIPGTSPEKLEPAARTSTTSSVPVSAPVTRSDIKLEKAITVPLTDTDYQRAANQMKTIEEVQVDMGPPKRYTKTLRLTSSQLKKLGLQEGANDISFTVNTRLQGKATCTAKLYLWKYDVQIVVSDIDGTITKSDALGHLFTFVGKDWTHPGIANLYTNIFKNGYHILYLTSRAIGQADTTRAYLRGIEQNSYQLPQGPVIMSPDRLMTALKREVIDRRPEEFKIACLKDILRLFGGRNPFYAGFGNRVTDAISYRAVGIPTFRIYSINPAGEIKMDYFLGYSSSYVKLTDMVDHIFPPNKQRFLTTSESTASLVPLVGTPDFRSENPSTADLSQIKKVDSKISLGTPKTPAMAKKPISFEPLEDDYNDFNYWREPIAVDIPELLVKPSLSPEKTTKNQTVHVSAHRKRRPLRHSVTATGSTSHSKNHKSQQHSLDSKLTSLSDQELSMTLSESESDSELSQSQPSDRGRPRQRRRSRKAEGEKSNQSVTLPAAESGTVKADQRKPPAAPTFNPSSVTLKRGENSFRFNAAEIKKKEEEEEDFGEEGEDWEEDEEEDETDDSPVNTYTYL